MTYYNLIHNSSCYVRADQQLECSIAEGKPLVGHHNPSKKPRSTPQKTKSHKQSHSFEKKLLRFSSTYLDQEWKSQKSPLSSLQSHILSNPPLKHRGKNKKNYPCIQHPPTHFSKVRSCDDLCDLFSWYTPGT